MEASTKIDATAIIIFGGAGDLAWRKLLPAIYNLFLDGWLPEHFEIIGLARTDLTDASFRKKIKEGIDKFSRTGKTKKEDWDKFSKTISYIAADFDDEGIYKKLKVRLDKTEQEWGEPMNRIFYMAVPPSFFELISTRISNAKLAENKTLSRLIIEKPFGHTLESAVALNDLLHGLYDECQLYRIDHFLGKETVQNILALRFANAMFEPLWNRNYIDHIQITVLEELGVETRGNYYETAGALRDMIQNHLLQLLCLVAMEVPVSFAADEVRNRKVDVLNAMRKITPDDVHEVAVRGQYGPGWIDGKKVPGYREEPDVAPKSAIETFAAIKLYIDNWRWQGVPIYMRTGKRMGENISVITIQFKPVPHQAFPIAAAENWQPNRLVLNINPHMGVQLRFQAKRPGLKMLLNPVDMVFNYADTYSSGTPEAYETLLLDIFRGDATLFMRADQVEAAWKLLMPVLNVWNANTAPVFPNYEAGTNGPEDANAMIARDGHNWLVTPLTETKKDATKK